MLLILKKISILLLIIWLGLLMSSCANQEPIKVGFAGELTGKRAERGVGSRNAIQLAIEKVNDNGGINGRLMQLISKDDQGDPEMAQKVDAELVKEGVVAIIGHLTSGQTAAVLEQMNEEQVVILSSAASSPHFSNQKDYFFRVVTASHVQGKALAEYAYDKMNLRQAVVVYDLDNQVYSEPIFEAFVDKYEALGGEVAQSFTFSSDETDLKAFTQEFLATQPAAVLFIASPVDTAFMLQYVNYLPGEKPVLLSSSWAHSNELLAKGGRAVEGLILGVTYDIDNPNPDFQEFVQEFEKKYGERPNGAATYAYEATQVLAEALKRTDGQAEGLPEALTTIKHFPVIQSQITFNEYGDVNRDIYIAVVEEELFTIVDTISGD